MLTSSNVEAGTDHAQVIVASGESEDSIRGRENGGPPEKGGQEPKTGTARRVLRISGS